jgi:hypothetical protein
VPDDGPTGYLLEVNLEYLEHLHDTYSKYPLAPESLVIPARRPQSIYKIVRQEVRCDTEQQV